MLGVRGVDVYTLGGSQGTVLRRLRRLKILRISESGRRSTFFRGVSAAKRQVGFRGTTATTSRTLKVLSTCTPRGGSLLSSLRKGRLVSHRLRRGIRVSKPRLVGATHKVCSLSHRCTRLETNVTGVRGRVRDLVP